MLIKRLSLCTSAAVLGPKRDPEKSTSQSVPNQTGTPKSQPVNQFRKMIAVYLCGASGKSVSGLANLFSKKVNRSISSGWGSGGVLDADSGIYLPRSVANYVTAYKRRAAICFQLKWIQLRPILCKWKFMCLRLQREPDWGLSCLVWLTFAWYRCYPTWKHTLKSWKMFFVNHNFSQFYLNLFACVWSRRLNVNFMHFKYYCHIRGFQPIPVC